MEKFVRIWKLGPRGGSKAGGGVLSFSVSGIEVEVCFHLLILLPSEMPWETRGLLISLAFSTPVTPPWVFSRPKANWPPAMRITLPLNSFIQSCLGYLVEEEKEVRSRCDHFLPSFRYLLLTGHLPGTALEELALNVFQTVSRMRTQEGLQHPDPWAVLFLLQGNPGVAEREGMVPPSHNLLAMEGQ